jgi:plastocyanin
MPGWSLSLMAASMLAMSVPAHAATIEITMDNLMISPANASARVGDTIEWTTRTCSPILRRREM